MNNVRWKFKRLTGPNFNATILPQFCHKFVTGFGRFHFWLAVACGIANASDAIEILCISFLLPSAECDFKLTSVDKGWISASMFIGNEAFGR